MKVPDRFKCLGRNFQNLPGWKTKRKIVVIESDDWGSIRMASRKTYDYLKSLGHEIDHNRYEHYDALECNEDVEILFDTLLKFKDINGNHPVITANNIVSNPDFRRIRDSEFEEYHFEPFTTTYKNYPDHDRVIGLLREGLSKGLFKPQFHGRDHVNVMEWLTALQNGNSNLHLAFSCKMISFTSSSGTDPKRQYMDALRYKSKDECDYILSSLIEGHNIFKNIWGYESKSFIAPCYIWDSEIENALKNEGVHYLQGILFQYQPSISSSKLEKTFHFTGQKSKVGQIYLVRNATFEPTSKTCFDPVGNCLKEISVAFRWRKPAIICSHRVNYMGSIIPANRTRNNDLLYQLLIGIMKHWPDVEFLSSDQLGEYIRTDYQDVK